MTASRWFGLEGSFNARHTGGYEAAGGVTRHDGLLRADSLHKLTAADQQLLIDAGLRTVIDLRYVGELDSAPNVFAAAGTVTYHHVPVFRVAPDTSPAAAPELAAIYRYMVDECQPGLRQALEIIADAEPGAVLIHCTAGKDRTGVLTALALAAVGVPRAIIVTDYALTTEAMQRLRPRLLSNPDLTPEAIAHIDKLLGSEPELMNDLLDYLEQAYGSIEAYLDHIGIAEAQRARLRARLVQLT
jgi:protein-tyrosine phosphatase